MYLIQDSPEEDIILECFQRLNRQWYGIQKDNSHDETTEGNWADQSHDIVVESVVSSVVVF